MAHPLYSRRGRSTLLLATILLLCFGAVLAQGEEHDIARPLVVALDVAFPPLAMKTATGESVGFSVDLGKELAQRLGRPGLEIVDVNFASSFAGLFAGRYELVLSTTTITTARASEMLFSEPYLPAGLDFLIPADRPVLESLDDLQGKAIAVNSGSAADNWLSQNEATYGFTIQRYNSNADSIQAVVSGRADVNVASFSRGALEQVPQLQLGFFLPTGADFGLAFRNEDADFRAEVENALECMKLDGTLAEIHERWLGELPDPKLSPSVVYAGYGAPGFEGYVADFHVPACE